MITNASLMAVKANQHNLARWLRAFQFSKQGFAAAWANESAFREEVVAAAVLCPAAFWVGSSRLEIALLITVTLQVLVIELINSAVEAVVDRIGPEQHPLAGRAKDIGSAAVLVSISIAVLCWLLALLG